MLHPMRLLAGWTAVALLSLGGCPNDDGPANGSDGATTATSGDPTSGDVGSSGDTAGEADTQAQTDGTSDGGGSSTGGTDTGTDTDGDEPDPSEALYDPETLLSISLTLSPESIASLEADPRVYAPATLTVHLAGGDEVVEDIGVRTKGEYNFRPLGQKASFKLKMDEFVPDQEYRGLTRMTLNGMLEDPSCVAERLVYAGFRAADLPAPRANHATLDVNGESYGLYLNLETEDKRFIRRWFDDDSGNIYEELGADWYPGNEQSFELETNETRNDRSDLTELFAAAVGAADETLLADVAGILDVDRFLRYSAWEGLVNQWDGYAYTQFGPNNYRLYHEPASNHFVILPWGMDMSMKPYGAPTVDFYAASGALLQRCIGVGSCREQYEAVIAQEADRFESLDLSAMADVIYDQIHDARVADPMAEVDVQTFEDTFVVVRQFTIDRPSGARAQLP